MINGKSSRYIIAGTIVIAATVFVIWLLYDPVSELSVNIPGQDKRPPRTADTNEVIKIGEKFTHYNDFKSELKGKWTRFRGADYDNTNKDEIELISQFSDNGPEILWSVDMGEGHAAPVIYNGRVYLLDYNEIKKADALRCFSLETGEELWKRWYNVHIKRNHGMSRTIPAITDSFIVTIGPRCHVMCANPETGDFLWGIDMEKEYGTETPFWNTGQCPIIDSNLAIIAPGGSSLIVAIDCSTGKVVWETPNPDKWKMSHSSILPMTYAGKKMYVYAAVGGICGISASGDDAGEMLWKIIDFSPTVVAPSPVIFEDGKIFQTAGYGAGSILFKISESNGKFSAKLLQKFKPKDGVASEQQTPVVYKGHMFAILPKDAGSLRNMFVCCKPDDCRNILWTSGKSHRFGLGPYMIADNKFWILNDDGTLSIVEASTSGFKLLDKARIIDGQDAWGPLAIADGKLLLRDSKTLVCIDVRKAKP